MPILFISIVCSFQLGLFEYEFIIYIRRYKSETKDLGPIPDNTSYFPNILYILQILNVKREVELGSKIG